MFVIQLIHYNSNEMWKQLNQSNESEAEPIALQNLKRLLAINICKCKVCDDQKQSLNFIRNKKFEVKKECSTNIASSVTRLHNSRSGNPFVDARKGVLCPGCFMALNLMRQKDLKYLKDEISETNPHMFSCDKSTTKVTNCIEKSTSPTKILIPRHINLSEKNVKNEIIPMSSSKNNKKNENCGTYCEEWQKHHKNVKMSYNENCLDMEKYVNSIRTTLPNLDF